MVRITGLKKTGRVISVDAESRRAEIDIGSMRVKTGFKELALAGSSSRKPKKNIGRHAPPRLNNTPSYEKQLNVIGLRVAEALPLIDKHIDSAVLHGADTLEIIHGRGTGRLMRAIHEHLQGHSQAERIISDSENPAGSGVTRVVIK
jgi:DNA mismatch repair protein MutS2